MHPATKYRDLQDAMPHHCFTWYFPPNPYQAFASAHILSLLANKRYYLVGSIYVLDSLTEHYINFTLVEPTL